MKIKNTSTSSNDNSLLCAYINIQTCNNLPALLVDGSSCSSTSSDGGDNSNSNSILDCTASSVDLTVSGRVVL